MCGILGALSTRGAPSSESTAFAAALARLEHRGPDASGVWSAEGTFGAITLGHRRLSILDLSPGANQPFTVDHEGRRVTVVYNGEVYNFAALARELEAIGARLRTTGDTEVIAHAYLAWGPACVRRLRGMFAFALWDHGGERLFLARDRLGIKPLYVYEDDDTVAFASELPALRIYAEGAGLDLSLDDTALWDFLTYMYVPTPKTPFRRVRKLPPATTALYERRRDAVTRR